MQSGRDVAPMGRPVTGERLRIRNLTKSFQMQDQSRVVLREFTLDVEPGEIITILGPSGCGKSTLIRLLAGLDEPDSVENSELSLGGKQLDGPGPDRGVVFQSYSSFPFLTSLQNVCFGLKELGMSRDEQESRAREYLELVGLEEYAHYYPKSLSGGQQQRVAIARTLAMRPKVLLMDEPFAALDAQTREDQQVELLRIWRETRPTILFVTHDISEAAFLGQRVVVLSRQPATVVAEFRTFDEIEEKLKTEGRRPDSATAMELWRATEANWLRTQPEFHCCVGRLREALPGRTDE